MLAQYTLGLSLKSGDGIGKDSVQGAQWLQKAADQGHKDARYEMGRCHQETGVGMHNSTLSAAFPPQYRQAAQCQQTHRRRFGDAGKRVEVFTDRDLKMADLEVNSCFGDGLTSQRTRVFML